MTDSSLVMLGGPRPDGGEVVDALTAHDTDGATCTSQRWRLEQVETRIEARLTALRHTRQLIRDALAACDAGDCQLVAAPSSDPEA